MCTCDVAHLGTAPFGHGFNHGLVVFRDNQVDFGKLVAGVEKSLDRVEGMGSNFDGSHLRNGSGKLLVS